MSEEHLFELFKKYEWSRLWLEITSKQCDTEICRLFKACLLAAWWQEAQESKLTLKSISFIATKPSHLFLRSLTMLCAGDLKAAIKDIELLERFKKAPPWMSDYLRLELAGRSRRFREQVSILNNALKKYKNIPDDWIFTALLQSLDQKDVDTSIFANVISGLEYYRSPLAKAFALRLNMIDYESFNDGVNAVSDFGAYCFGLYSAAFSSLGKAHPRECIKIIDKLAELGHLDKPLITIWLGTAISHPDGWAYLQERAVKASSLSPQTLRAQGDIATFRLIHYWCDNNYKQVFQIVSQFHSYMQLKADKNNKFNLIFFRYILHLAADRQDNPLLYDTQSVNAKLLVIGESHSLSPLNACFNWQGQKVVAQKGFVIGVKMHHLSVKSPNHNQACVTAHIELAEPKSHLLFAIGEIDCRPNEGIWRVYKKKGGDVKQIARDTVYGYVRFLDEQLTKKSFASITLQGVPAPLYALTDEMNPGNSEMFLDMIKYVNQLIKSEALNRKWAFLDVYQATADQNAKSNAKYHIDDFHLKPSFYAEAERFLIL